MTKLLAILLLLAGSVSAKPRTELSGFANATPRDRWLAEESRIRSLPDQLRLTGEDCRQRGGHVECASWAGMNRLAEPVQITVEVDHPPLIAVNGQAFWTEPTTRRERRDTYAAAGVVGEIDAAERKCLDAYRWSAATDAASTIIALTCNGVREANPLLGSHPAPLTIAAFSVAVYGIEYQFAKRSNRYESSAPAICTSALMKFGATAFNLMVASRASGCL